MDRAYSSFNLTTCKPTSPDPGWWWGRGHPAPTCQVNRCIGWVLLVACFAWAAWVGIGSFTGRDVSALGSAPSMAALAGMALVQLAAAHILNLSAEISWIRPTAAWFIGLGGSVYAVGTVMHIRLAPGAWLVVAGALINLAGFMLLARMGARWGGARDLRLILAIFCSGLLLHAVVDLIVVTPNLLFVSHIGPEDGIRLRMLRLARAAGATLPVLALLHHGLAVRADPDSWAVRWGRVTMWGGAISMATILTAAGVIFPGLRLLLPIPALAVFVGTATGVRLARRHAGPFEIWGWLLIVLSMAGGLLISMVAFDGPLPPPDIIGDYNNFARQLIRQAHIYTILLGMAGIFISRELNRGCFAVSPLSGRRIP